MNSKLVYRGNHATHTLGVSWTTNQELGLENLYKIFETRAKRQGIPGPTREFADWLYTNYLAKLSTQGFEFLIDESDFKNEVAVTETPVEDFSGINPTDSSEQASSTTAAENFTSNAPKPTSADHTVTVESGELKTSASLDEAQQRLKAMRHQDTVGTVERSAPQQLPPSDMASFARSVPPAGSQVMSGDDLAKTKSLQSSVGEKAVSTVLVPSGDSEGVEARKVEAVTAEQVGTAKNELANANRGSKVLIPDEIREDGTKSGVVSGDHFSTSNQIVNPAPETASKESNSQKVNKNFQGFQGMTSSTEISIDDIVRNPDPIKAKELINSCSSSRTLKAARNMFRRKGDQRMVDTIDVRLQQLPPVSM